LNEALDKNKYWNGENYMRKYFSKAKAELIQLKYLPVTIPFLKFPDDVSFDDTIDEEIKVC
jgi:hypothetical protein